MNIFSWLIALLSGNSERLCKSIACEVKFQLLTDTAKLPTKSRGSDAGIDIYSDCNIVSYPHTVVKVETGVAWQPPTGWCAKIEDRSSIGSSGLKQVGGVIDEEYRGEIIVCLANVTEFIIEIKKGQKIAQLLLHRVPNVIITEVDYLEESDRADKGFGSSGK